MDPQSSTNLFNGYAFLADFQESRSKELIHSIKKLEKKSGFKVTCYWNRVWEYPFLFHTIQTATQKGSVLDAGSGKSLLPFMLQQYGFDVLALDIDDGSFYTKGSLPQWYAKQNQRLQTNVRFMNGSILQLEIPSDTFNIVYSMSVIEHLGSPMLALQELWRVLKPDGIFLLTVDVSLNSSSYLPEKSYLEMKSFLDEHGTPLHAFREKNLSSLITTDWYKKYQPKMLPWKVKRRKIKTILKDMIRKEGLIIRNKPFHSLAISGLAYRKISL